MTPGRAESFRARAGAAQAPVEDSVARVIASWHDARPQLNVDPIAITARLARLDSLLRPRLEAVFARHGLRGADFAMLATLVRLGREDVSQARLAAELGLSPGTVSLRLDRLERLRFARRRADPDDGRGALVVLTRRGRRTFEACAPEHLANAGELIAGLSDNDREQLGALLAMLLRSLEGPSEGSASDSDQR